MLANFEDSHIIGSLRAFLERGREGDKTIFMVPEFAPMIKAVILCATLIYEIIGPAVTKITLEKAGEIQEA